MRNDLYHIVSGASEDRFDRADTLEEALRIAREADAKATQAAADAAEARRAAESAENQARLTTERSDRIYQRTLQK